MFGFLEEANKVPSSKKSVSRSDESDGLLNNAYSLWIGHNKCLLSGGSDLYTNYHGAWTAMQEPRRAGD